MGRSNTVTLLPLDRYSQIMGIRSPHFNQVNGAKAPLGGGCDDIWDQDARDALAWTMKQAEDLIANELSFQPIPAFVTDELQQEALTGVRWDWQNAELKTNYGYVVEYGREQLTLVQANATVTYQDLDHDPLGREETAIIAGLAYSDLPACTQPCDVAIFFRVVDGAEDDADSRWEIKPIRVDIDGSTMSIRADASMFVKPSNWLLTKQNSIAESGKPNNDWIVNWDVSTNFVTAVDVYCRSVNTTLPVTLKWDRRCRCVETPCSHRTQTGCAQSTDFKRGFFRPRPATGNNEFALPLDCFAPPESVCVNYRAGFPLDRNCRMDANLERAIVKLTNVLLPEPPCNFCDAAQSIWEKDRENVDPLTPEAASMPWDLYSKGALEAWRIVKKMAMGRGGKMGRQ